MIDLNMPIFGPAESDFIAILALCVAGGSSVFTAFAFLKTYGRNRKSEQIRIARDIRDDINNKIGARDDFIFNKKYPEEGSLEEKRKWIIDLLRILIAAKAALGYFTLLVKQKEIYDPNILVYYKKANLKNLNDIDNKYEFIDSEMKHDTDLEASLRDVFPSEAADPFSEITNIRRELSQDKEVWEHIPTISLWTRMLTEGFKMVESEGYEVISDTKRDTDNYKK